MSDAVRLLVLVLAAFGCAAGTAWLHPRAPELAWREPGVVAAAEARALRGALWVDAREAREFAAGTLPGAVLLNETSWSELAPGFLAAWSPDRPVVVFCGSDACPAARRVRERLLREFGIESRVLEGGLAGWAP